MAISITTQLVIISLILKNRNEIHESIASRNTWNDSYDYIVVGAGSAGAVVANRLTENTSVSTLLLEAGGAQGTINDIPGVFPLSLSAVNQLWYYQTVPQNDFAFAYNRVSNIVQGRIIGGGSAINGMLYNRGNPIDFDKWVSDYGAQGWDYNHVLPYFIKSENNTDFEITSSNPGYHGKDGPLGLSSNQNPLPFYTKLLKAFNEFGLETVDINGAKQLGSSIPQFTIKDGIRQSTGNAYIDPNPHPNNLHILINAYVTKVLFRQTDESFKAIGVQFMKNNTLYEVMANKEVILTAGAIRSPHILLLSGIGPKEQLKQFSIESIADLPVGQNLQDHPGATIFATVKNVSYDVAKMYNVEQMYQLLINGTGPLSKRDHLIVNYHNIMSNEIRTWPNCFTETSLIGSLNTGLAYISMYSNKTEDWVKYFEPYSGINSIVFITKLYRSESRGYISLASSNPMDSPLIDPKYLSHPQDIKDYIQCMKNMFNFINYTSISKDIQLIPEPIPGCNRCPNQDIYDCDSYIECYIRTVGKTELHLSGSCRMGSSERSDTVVDPSLRVKGVTGLRVCDASVMPLLPNANTMAATIMIGEKCSDIIKSQQ